MIRRSFLGTLPMLGGAAGAMPPQARAAARRILRPPVADLHNALAIAWERQPDTGLFQSVSCQGMRLVYRGTRGVVSASIEAGGGAPVTLDAASPVSTAGPVRATLGHRLLRVRPQGGEDALEATVTLRNTGSRAAEVNLAFATSAHPSRSYPLERVHLPLTAGPHAELKQLGMAAMMECDQPRTAVAHYLEPSGSDPAASTTARLLLIPLADLHHPDAACRVALFASPETPWRFGGVDQPRGETAWTCGTRLNLQPGGESSVRCFLFLHQAQADVAWRAFHTLAHPDPYPEIAWLRDVKVHYYDFLGPGGPNGRRGAGYDADAAHFGEFQVGMATQHGYYPVWGDYIHPDRKQWQAMPRDVHGPAPMSIARMRERCAAARAAGARAAIYIHAAGFDAAAREAASLQEAVLVHADGSRPPYAWDGPDITGQCWRMSLAAPEWSAYLLRQAQWIMELVAPDAIVVDETFAGLGYDHHPNRKGRVSPGAIRWMKDLRKLVRSFGPDKAVLTSDCTLGSFVLWADGEAGDHAYAGLLGAEAYRRAPVRYLSALGGKPWLACAWQSRTFWNEQMDLARKTGAAVGVSNGWLEYTGLTAIEPDRRARMLRDISTL